MFVTLFIILCVSLVTSNVLARQICFEDLGCFDNNFPFDNTGPVLPDAPHMINTKFMLVTRNKQGNSSVFQPTILNTTDTNLPDFQATKPLEIVIHGFAQSASAEWVMHLVESLLQSMDCNVIVVDWGDGAKFPHYLQAAANIRVVGEQLRQLLISLVDRGVRLSDVHIIGHSLGAHVANHAARNLSGTINRITGLDPAEPLFQDHHSDVRLDVNDANFVDVIHTNGKPFYLGGAGFSKALGHADFFVNGGEDQPGCPAELQTSIENLLEGDVQGAARVLSCSHSRAHDIYIESIKSQSCHFIAYPCEDTDAFNSGQCLECKDNNCQRLGYHVKVDRPQGKFFLKTRHKWPYCGHHHAITVTTSRNSTAKGQVFFKFIQGKNESEDVPLFKHDVTFGPAPVNAVIVTSAPIVQLIGVMLTYRRHQSWLPWLSGDEFWRPLKIELHTGVDEHIGYIVDVNGEGVRSGETKFVAARKINSDN